MNVLYCESRYFCNITESGKLNYLTNHLTGPIIGKGLMIFQEVKTYFGILVSTQFIDHNIYLHSQNNIMTTAG